jgi:hypothetical protein
MLGNHDGVAFGFRPVLIPAPPPRSMASQPKAICDPPPHRREVPVAREQRKLAAILAADVVGYSRLMGRGESGPRRACVRSARPLAAHSRSTRRLRCSSSHRGLVVLERQVSNCLEHCDFYHIGQCLALLV